METTSGIYENNPDPVSDEHFEPGTLRHLVIGNRARMLDPRRTPVRITSVEASIGMFGVQVEAFEDVGARWDLPLEDVSHFQFERAAGKRSARAAAELKKVEERFNQTIQIEASKEAHTRTAEAIDEQRALIRAELDAHPGLREIDIQGCVRTRLGAKDAAAALQSLLRHAGLESLERSFAQTYVSNPYSGEVVKGHSIVIAEMGLCPYTGKMVRDDRLFEGDGSKQRRREHIVLRLAYMQELMALLNVETVDLYRGMAVDGVLEARPPTPLVAATFSREVAMSHFESPAQVSTLVRQGVPVSRLFMTFLETSAMNERYREAEAVLIGAPGKLAF
jgi:hypothetical protein